ncbi:MAG: ribosomal protein S18-alanine N-acetyltransferase [Clostridia bacterium]|nr:ribosomal protein S18-alanine N-acetyltransferase [Clostridia bacterium]
MNNISITKADISHLEQIEAIEKTLKHRNLSYDSIKKDLERDNTYYLVAIDNTTNNVVGYIGCELLVDHADITAVATGKKHLKQGIASSLLNTLEKHLQEKQIESIFLEVRTSNIPAINLYTKLNYSKISTRAKYYDNLEDANIMKKDLI